MNPKKKKQKNIKCNIITQAYRTRCSSETHRVRPESLKTFRFQQGELNLLRVAYLWKRWFPISFCRETPFSTATQSTNQPLKNNKRMLIAAVFQFCRSSAKRQLKTSQDDTKLCQLQISVNSKSWTLRKFSTWILFPSSSPIKSCSLPFSSWPSFSFPSLFT